MKIEVRNSCHEFASYRAARVKSLFNVESGAEFCLDAALPIDDDGWRIGAIIGPSGSGKTSIGKALWGGGSLYEPGSGWAKDRPIIDCVGEASDFDAATAALSAVGLGDVPAWLRPYHVLSNGERFRADLAKIVCDSPSKIVIDEFTSVVDRQIAKIGAMAFGKAWKRSGGQCVVLSCHYDIVEWLEPDWVFDTATGKYSGRGLWRRPRFDLQIYRTDWRFWHLFEKHHYLNLPRMICGICYVGTVDGELVCHVGVSTKNVSTSVEARACCLVVLPEWQGAGVGTRFLDAVAEIQLQGGEGARLPGRRLTTIFHTSHPGLAAALRRSQKWRQVSQCLCGGDRNESAARIGAKRKGAIQSGYGGHFRAVQGFRYYGDNACRQDSKSRS